MSATEGVAPVPAASGRGTPLQRARASMVAGISWLACRLPEGPLIRLSGPLGALWYRLAPRRAAQARRNMRRIAGWLAEREMGPPEARAAATDPVALERLVRELFRSAARYYIELTRTPVMGGSYALARMVIDDPEVLDEALDRLDGTMFIGLHLGSIELPVAYLTARTGRVTMAPMEAVPDPALQRFLERSRARAGIVAVPIRDARRLLTAAIARGETVGIVADRDVTGTGVEVELFGAPARLPVGPALLAVETGARVFTAAVRWGPSDRYFARVERLSIPADGSRRERIVAALAALARSMERQVAIAPGQWWAAFHPIWPDLAEAEDRGPGRPMSDR